MTLTIGMNRQAIFHLLNRYTLLENKGNIIFLNSANKKKSDIWFTVSHQLSNDSFDIVGINYHGDIL